MKNEAVSIYLEKAGARWNLVEKLLEEQKLKKLAYRGDTFYIRTLRRTKTG